MKKNLKKLVLQKRTVATLVNNEQKAMKGGLSYTCVCSRRIICTAAKIEQ